MKVTHLISIAAIAAGLAFSGSAMAEKAGGTAVNINADTKSVTVVTAGGKTVDIMRNQDNSATINPDFAKTSRPCPPFCIQPDKIGDVETIFENAMLDYLEKQSNGDNSIFVIDSRTPDWAGKGTIPGATNVPWTGLNP